MRRVVITGLGLVTPLGCGVKQTWDNILASRSGVSAITACDVSDLPARVAGEVKRGTGAGEFNPDNYIEPKEQKAMSALKMARSERRRLKMPAGNQWMRNHGCVPV